MPGIIPGPGGGWYMGEGPIDETCPCSVNGSLVIGKL